MAEIERIPFDFSGDGCFAEMNKLDGIMCSNHWSSRTLRYNDERTILLMRLLEIGGIAVYKCGYIRKTETPEIRSRANDFNMFMNKRYVGQTLKDIAAIFFNQEYDARRTTYNCLFFPELKAFVRYDGLPPDRLLELLEQEGCEAVMLFSDGCVDNEEDAFYSFTLAMPKDKFLNTLDELRGRISGAMHEAIREANEKLRHIIPSPSEWTDSE